MQAGESGLTPGLCERKPDEACPLHSLNTKPAGFLILGGRSAFSTVHDGKLVQCELHFLPPKDDAAGAVRSEKGDSAMAETAVNLWGSKCFGSLPAPGAFKKHVPHTCGIHSYITRRDAQDGHGQRWGYGSHRLRPGHPNQPGLLDRCNPSILLSRLPRTRWVQCCQSDKIEICNHSVPVKVASGLPGRPKASCI